MDNTTSLEFAQMVRAAGSQARERGWKVPGFRSPPRKPGVDRTVRYHPTDGTATVSVRVILRPPIHVALDICAGVLVVNDIDPHSPAAGQYRGAVLADLGIPGVPEPDVPAPDL